MQEAVTIQKDREKRLTELKAKQDIAREAPASPPPSVEVPKSNDPTLLISSGPEEVKSDNSEHVSPDEVPLKLKGELEVPPASPHVATAQTRSKRKQIVEELFATEEHYVQDLQKVVKVTSFLFNYKIRVRRQLF